MSKFEVSLGYPQVYPLCLVERIPGRQTSCFNLSLGVSGGGQLIPLETFQNVTLFFAHFLFTQQFPPSQSWLLLHNAQSIVRRTLDALNLIPPTPIRTGDLEITVTIQALYTIK